MEKNFYLDAHMGEKIFVRSWEVDCPVAVVHIVHGMAEHSARYIDFANFLNENRISAYAGDHRGHGKTIGNITEKGVVGKNGIELIVEDQLVLAGHIQKRNPGVPFFILGHSMGSFITQRVMQKNPDLNMRGAILCGSNGKFGVELPLGRLLAKLISYLKGENLSPLLDFLTFLSYNKKTKKRNRYDWLCSDEKVVEKYIEDPLCGGVLPANFYYSLFSLISEVEKKENLKKMCKDIPILIISGKDDPVGKYGKGVISLYRRYLKLHFKNIQLKLYENSRHEILNEASKLTVYADVLTWLKDLL